MKYRAFGPTGRDVSVIGMGTWNMDIRSRRNAVAALKMGLDQGVNHVDTAEMYGDAEDIVGEAIQGRRDEVFLVSKVLPQNASRSGTRTACERSLRRLGTDRLDCYLLHWRGGHPLEETIAAFAELRQEGKIKAWGVSNFDTDDLEEAQAIAAKAGEAIACNQVLYHLQERAVEHSVLPWCAKHGVALTAYSPFGSGDFPEPDTAGGRVLSKVASAHGATAHQVALAFLVRNQAAFAIPKAADPKHQEKNSAAGDLVLGEDDLAQIESAFPLGPKPRSLPMI